MVTKIEKDEVTGTATTGHEWDGIKELNTPLPKWWLYTFYGCVIWATRLYRHVSSLADAPRGNGRSSRLLVAG